tara:strand:+ start:251 stop:658 length:408 start_codon:yes stop_codon:yes gene_type:complete
MDIREDLLSKLGGEVVQPQNQQNIVDLTGDENQPAESQPTTQEPSNVVDLTQESSLNTEETNVDESQVSQQEEGEEISDDEVVLQYLSEKLGRDLTSFDDLNYTSEQQTTMTLLAISFELSMSMLKTLVVQFKIT